MKKILSSILWAVCFYLVIIISLSVALSQKSFYSFFIKTSTEYNSSFVISQANWHPTNPSVILSNLKLENDRQKIVVQEILIEFSLFDLIDKNFISKLIIKDITIDNQSFSDQEGNIFGFVDTLGLIRELNIKELKVRFSDLAEYVNLDLESFHTEGGLNLKISLKDEEGGFFKLGLFPHSDRSRALFQGYVLADKFKIDRNILRNFCIDCEYGAELNTSVLFNLFDQKPLNLKGNLDMSLDREIYGISSLSSSFILKDSKEVSIQVSSFLNKDIELKVPDFFLKLSPSEKKIVIPKINLSKDKFLQYIFRKIDNPFLDGLKGTLKNSVIRLDSDREVLKTSISDLGIKHNSFTLGGLEGELSLNEEVGKLKLFSPSIQLTSGNYLNKNLNFNNFKSALDLKISRDGIQILPSAFSMIIDNQQFNGLVKIYSIPTDGLGNIDLRVESNAMDYQLALNLLPNTGYLSNIKSSITNLINCGSIEDINVILRLPFDGFFNNNSSSFGMQASTRNACLNVNGFPLSNANTSFQINNLAIKGEIKSANFLGSTLSADFETISDSSGITLDIQGVSQGPFVTLLNILSDETISQRDSSGVHKTSFKFLAPLKKNISFLDEEVFLSVISKIDKGKFNSKDTGFSIDNIFSSFNYNNSIGFNKGFISFQLNSVPITLDLDKDLSDKDYTVFNANNFLKFANLVPKTLKKSFSGSSRGTFKLVVPSLIRGRDIKEVYIQLSTDLTGTEIDLPSPFGKESNEPIPANLEYYPNFNNQYSKFQFRYGDKFRGKLNIFEEEIEGFIIAGKKKQSISIESDKILLVGTIPKLDLSLLSSLEFSQENQTPNLEIRKLEVDEILLSNFSFPKTILKSSNSDRYLELFIENRNILGKVYIPKLSNLEPILDLETFNFNFSESSNNSSFLDIYKQLDRNLKFQIDSLVLNSVNYGNWSFDLKPSNSAIIIDRLKGTYGKWGLTNTSKDVSRLSIFKEGFGWKTELESKIYSGSPEKGFIQLGLVPNFEMDTIFAETKITWSSLPWEFDYDAFNGEVYLEIDGLLIENQEDLQAQNNLLRLVNIFNITDSFEKVTNLDFRKLYKSGFTADSVKGTFNVSPYSISFDSPMVFRSGSSEFKWQGNIARDSNGVLDSIDLTVIMTLPLREYLPAYAFLLGGPLTAGVVYIAGKAFERNLDQLSSGSWSIKGTLKDPKTSFNGWFEKSTD